MKKKTIIANCLKVLTIVLCIGMFTLYCKYMSVVCEVPPTGDLNVRLRNESTCSLWGGGYSWIGSTSDGTVLAEREHYVKDGVFNEYSYWVYDIGAAKEGTVTLEYTLYHQSGSNEPEACGSFYLQFEVERDGTITQVAGADAPDREEKWDVFWQEIGYAVDQYYGYAFYLLKYVLYNVIGRLWYIFS